MNTFTLDIIVAMILIVLVNNPILKFLQSTFGMNFILSEILIALLIIIVIYLLNRFVIKKFKK